MDNPTSSKRILVVDDNPDAADSVAELMKALGHVAATAYCGAQALATCSAFDPDVVFLDIGMPGMDGYETLAELRRASRPRQCKIVALTAWGMPTRAEK